MPQYDFATLSSTDFEHLMRDVWNAAENLQLQCFPEGRDGGIDVREIRADGTVVVGQCKHYHRSSRNALLGAVEKEKSKHGRLVANHYLFATTFPITAALIDEIASILDVPATNIWGPDRINEALQNFPEIERNHFKLWFPSTAILQAIIHSGIHNRTRALLERIPDETKYWVDTPALPVAREILEREGVCIVTGPPGAGKSCLASRLLLEAMTDGWSVICMSEGPRDAWKMCTPAAKQLFYFDDFLGETTLAKWAVDQAPDLRNFIAHVRRNQADKRLVMTSRQQIIHQAVDEASDALNELDRDPFVCTIALEDLDRATKIEILTAHLTLSKLSDVERDLARVDRRIPTLSVHHSFNPRIIRAVAENLGETSTANQALSELEATFDNPKLVWQTSYKSVSARARGILLTLATLPPRPVALRKLREFSRYEGSATEWLDELRTIEPSWVRIVDLETEKAITFANPSCRHYLLSILDDDDYAEEYIAQLACLDQLVNLVQEAGMISATLTVAQRDERSRLASALQRQCLELVSRVKSWTTETVSANAATNKVMSTFRDAARVLAALGTPTTTGWLVDRVRDFLGSDSRTLPTHESLALASQLSSMDIPAGDRTEVVGALIEAGLRGATTSRDLRAYEALRPDVRTAALDLIARQRAEKVIGDEWELLLTCSGDAEEKIARGHELYAQALWYGIELSFGDLVDVLPDEADSIDTLPAQE
ncbi:nSTAND3 domain-containing NTPase [Nocardia farcinica]|uniref:nSTAND3 domain-containing NTPase n=1 Tax=Nocardia farcinica TaxID=37329 RepID=UPI0018946AC2|nr:restriction endonuclease [Nocardia farcinica]MBF6072583.1 restriction endonuclease [Nocardia farcinica]